jgi:hypothetical protein
MLQSTEGELARCISLVARSIRGIYDVAIVGADRRA